MDEDDLADAFRTGSAEGVRAVYERYSGAVFTIALRVLGDRELAADAAQVTFLNAWRACGTLEPGRPLAPWLFTIARRAAIDLYRRRAHGPEPVEPKDDATIALPPSMECIWEAWQIRIALEERGMISELTASNRVAHWAYSQTEAVNGLTWIRADELVPVGAEWRQFLM